MESLHCFTCYFDMKIFGKLGNEPNVLLVRLRYIQIDQIDEDRFSYLQTKILAQRRSSEYIEINVMKVSVSVMNGDRMQEYYYITYCGGFCSVANITFPRKYPMQFESEYPNLGSSQKQNISEDRIEQNRLIAVDMFGYLSLPIG